MMLRSASPTRVRALVVSICALFLPPIFAGCSEQVEVAPEQQAAGRKVKADILKGMTNPKGAAEASGKSKSKRKAGSGTQDQDPF